MRHVHRNVLIVGSHRLHAHRLASGTASQDGRTVGLCAEVAVDDGDESEALRVCEAHVGDEATGRVGLRDHVEVAQERIALCRFDKLVGGRE